MKERVDALLVARGLCDSREQAKRLVLAGEVRSGDRLIEKPSVTLEADAPLEVKEKLKYVGRGGLKMEGALEGFGIDVTGLICADIGASTGGFTDCLLQRGAAKVHAVDVGTNQLAWKIRSDPRVVVKEKFNARHMVPDDLGDPIALAVMDLSFISLTKVLPAVFSVLGEGGQVVCLIKPQFELQADDLGKGGIVKNPALYTQVEQRVRQACQAAGLDVLDWFASAIHGGDGNQEFFIHARRAA